MSWNIELPDTQFFIGHAGNRYPDDVQHLIHRVDSDEFTCLMNEVNDQNVISIDTETTGLNIARDVPLYWSMAYGSNRRITLREDTLDLFRPIFAKPGIQWIFANAKYDMHILGNNGIYLEGDCIDTQVMHALLYEDRRHALKLMSDHILGWTWADFETTFGKMNIQLGKERVERLNRACQRLGPVSEPIHEKRICGPEDLIRIAENENLALLIEYASNDAWGTLLIFWALKKQLEEAWTHSLFSNKPPYINTMWDFFDRIEKPYTKVLWKMERRGIMLDKQKLIDAEPDAIKAIARIERKIVNHAGRMINPNSPKQMREYFVDQEGLKPLAMSKGGKTGVRQPKVDKKFMERYENEHPVVSLMQEYRKYSKLYGTYIKGMGRMLDYNDRIHTHFNQDVARTGRLSSSEPNLQNIPRPENDYWNLRGAFITLPGWKIIACDYEQLEMRLLACAAQEQDMADIFLRGWDVHSGNGSLMYDVPYEDVAAGKKLDKAAEKMSDAELIQEAEAKSPGMFSRCDGDIHAYVRYCAQCRADAKNIGFGLNYGMGSKKLASDLGCTSQEAIEKIKTYKGRYPAVDSFMKEAVEEGRKYGYAFTLMGRRRNIPMIGSNRRDERALGERLAVNTQIQGSAADVCRAAQLSIDSYGLEREHECYMLLQVHDELVFELPEGNAEPAKRDIEELMAHPFCMDLMVPLTAAAEHGNNWGEAK